MFGSSPRGRGTLRTPLLQTILTRFIPAWTGNTYGNTSTIMVSPVHPRVDGEHVWKYINDHGVSGSSPRGRGTPVCVQSSFPPYRFIPAWAGNTRCAWERINLSSVHPRVGGEHVPLSAHYSDVFGSSPRGRGTRHDYRQPWRSRRFIPAWAGNTLGLSPPRNGRSVHPRVGGEHFGRLPTEQPDNGSSPRGRGTQVSNVQRSMFNRFIPAWAGNTLGYCSSAVHVSVHPRVGGEHTAFQMPSSTSFGSSPRGRGTRHDRRQAIRHCRFIPAWAGNTLETPSPLTCLAVHPRVGGEHLTVVIVVVRIGGSSPRGRGTRTRPAMRATKLRFIPAWAGNTLLFLNPAWGL